MLLMNIADFDYPLPPERIAIHPPKVRGQSRLLILDRSSGSTTHQKYGDFINYLNTGDILVINQTKVIKARLLVKNSIGENRELLLIEKHGKHDNWYQHKAVYRGKIRQNEILNLHGNKLVVKEILDGGITVIQSSKDLLFLAEKYGTVPLPPYMKRSSNKEDIERYQTTFAVEPGSVAAPTASLNFTNEMQIKLKAKGVQVCSLTLHVGLGTFLPIRTDAVEEHVMHKEYFEIPKQTVKLIQDARQDGKKVFALGTTVTRTLEYCTDQILGYEHQDLSGEADIFIYPGYKFKMVDGLLTNFHAPKSTVLMMAAALAGWDNLLAAYQEAIARKYSLLSYGDSMLII